MRLIVSDSSCLIDLRKASLLEAFLELPYQALIPDALFEEELVRFTPAQKDEGWLRCRPATPARAAI